MTQPDRHTVDTITSDALDQLYARAEQAETELDRLTAMATRYADRAIENGKRAERAEAAIERVRAVAQRMQDWDSHIRSTERWVSDIRAALDPQEPQPDAAVREPVCTCTWAGLELRRCPVHEPTT